MRRPTLPGLARALVAAPAAVLLMAASDEAGSAAFAPKEVADICSQAEDRQHCGRLIEKRQLVRYPDLGARDGDTLTLRLQGGGTWSFTDTETESRAVWGYLPESDAVVLLTLRGEKVGFGVLLRASGTETDVANAPVSSPDATLLATADFCEQVCENEIAVWRIVDGRLEKDRFYRPRTQWLDVAVQWKDANTLLVERRTAVLATPQVFEFRLTDPGWMRIDAKHR